MIPSRWPTAGLEVNVHVLFCKFGLAVKVLIRCSGPTGNEIRLSASLPARSNNDSPSSHRQLLKDKCGLSQKLLYSFSSIGSGAGGWCYLGPLVFNVPSLPAFSKHSFPLPFLPAQNSFGKQGRVVKGKLRPCKRMPLYSQHVGHVPWISPAR